MHWTILAIVVLTGFASPALAQESGPSLNDVKVAEAHITWRYAQPLETYDRYYSFALDRGQKIIRGVYRYQGDHGGAIYIVPPAQEPFVYDGGCSMIDAEFDAETKVLLGIACHGEPMAPRQRRAQD